MRKLIVVVASVLFGTLGCASNKGTGDPGVNEEAKQMDASRSEFESVKDPPLNADTRFAAGQLSETEGNLPLAIEQYNAALKLNPKHVASLYRLALVESQLKKFPESIDTWNRYIAATDNAAVGYSNLGFCQELSGDDKAAEASFQDGIKRDEKNQLCRVNYGLLLAREDRVEEAKEQFCAVLTEAQAHYNIASVLQQRGKKAAAKAEYLEAIKSDPQFVDAQTRLAEMDRN